MRVLSSFQAHRATIVICRKDESVLGQSNVLGAQNLEKGIVPDITSLLQELASLCTRHFPMHIGVDG